MKKILLSLAVVASLLGTGCRTTITQDAVDGIGILTTNVVNLGVEHRALLERAGPPALPPGPEGETEEQLAARQKANHEAWTAKVEHDLALLAAQDTLAQKTNEWAQACAPNPKTEE